MSTISIATPRGPASVVVEVVSTPEQIQRGLMYRHYLHPDAGMLFVMGRRDAWAFYMRNTFIPLDMIYIDDDMRVTGVVHDAEPCTETLRSVGAPSSFVLEVNGGWAREHGVEAGALVRFVGVR
jgi:hypothetical protein